MGFSDFLEKWKIENSVPEQMSRVILDFYHQYSKEARGETEELIQNRFLQFLHEIKKQLESPYGFTPYHPAERSGAIDYYQFGLDFFRPLLDQEKSEILGKEQFQKLDAFIHSGENAVLFTNHQIEADPQILSLLLSEEFPYLSEHCIWVSGTKVCQDPLSVPFSRGRDLLCITSKKRMNEDPEARFDQQQKNKRTMEVMSSLLQEGSKCIIVAPSGGRDRADNDGVVRTISHLDPKAIQMFYLMSSKAKVKTHFFPLSLSTHKILPPCDDFKDEEVEPRLPSYSSAYAYLGEELDMESAPESLQSDRRAAQEWRAQEIEKKIQMGFNKIHSSQ
ncbi:MAG: hypothetical protein CMO81_07890 [Waddliaceae bacterium]|nr:hypothetical protein [Waddliaceae bacterium]